MNIVSRYFAVWTMTGIATINLHAIEPADIPHYEGEKSHVIKAANPKTLQAKSVTFTQHLAGGPAKNVQTLAPEDVEKRFAVYDKKKEHSDGFAVMGELIERLKKLPKDRYSFSTYKHKQEQELDYLLFFPANYDKSKTYPLILSLHGSGERVEKDMLVLAGRNAGPVVAALDQQEKHPCFILVPRTRTGWITSGAAVAGLVDKVIATHSVDTSRVFVMGQSMGRAGTMQMALNHSRLFAAVVPIVGFASSPKPHRLNCPMWMFTGEFDKRKKRNVEFYEAARDAGKDIRLTIFCLRGHMCHHLVYYHPGFWEWLFSQKKEAAEKSAALERSNVTVASYNIADFNICKGEAGFSLDAQAAVLNKMKPDIICFQEVVKDALGQGRHYPNEDRVAKMAELVGFKHTMFSKPPDDDLRWPPLHMRYGLSIISRWPLTDTATYKFRHLTDDDPGYPRLLLTAVVHPDNGLPKFRIATVHLMHNGPSGGGRNDRVIMAEFIKTKFKNDPMPMIMGGDYNSKNGSKEMLMLLNGGGWVNATPDYGIDKILYRLSEDWEVTETKTISSPASDHNPIQATFKYTAPP